MDGSSFLDACRQRAALSIGRKYKLTNPSFSSWQLVCLSIAILFRLAVAGSADVLGGSFAIAVIVLAFALTGTRRSRILAAHR